MTFWEHLDEMRSGIIRCVVVLMVLCVGLFCLKDQVFRLMLWPQQPDFPLWQWLSRAGLDTQAPHIELINTELASQFVVHLEVALGLAVLLALPYIMGEGLHFVLPAFESGSRRILVRTTAVAYLLFLLGVVINYLVLFPCTFRFLGTYQVSEQVVNHINLQSYISSLLIMSMMIGLIFELPIVCSLLARMGLIHAGGMRKYRKHAIVAIFILAAIITPTGDAFTLCLVALPICLLYELSIAIVRLREVAA